MSNVDDSLLEVWEMKEAVYCDYINSNYDNIVDYIDNEMIEIKKIYNLKYHFIGDENQKQLTTA